jgi:hypothetical protein
MRADSRTRTRVADSALFWATWAIAAVAIIAEMGTDIHFELSRMFSHIHLVVCLGAMSALCGVYMQSRIGAAGCLVCADHAARGAGRPGGFRPCRFLWRNLRSALYQSLAPLATALSAVLGTHWHLLRGWTDLRADVISDLGIVAAVLVGPLLSLAIVLRSLARCYMRDAAPRADADAMALGAVVSIFSTPATLLFVNMVADAVGSGEGASDTRPVVGSALCFAAAAVICGSQWDAACRAVARALQVPAWPDAEGAEPPPC